jgi:Flp pilus assembly protein TadG
MATFKKLRARAARRLDYRARSRSGAAAIEFAVVAPVFLSLMFGTFEVGWFYFVNSQIDASTVEAARLIRTGQAQKSNLTKEEFYDRVCARLAALGPCDGKLTVEVKHFDTFAELATDTSSMACSDDTQAEINALPYEPGADNDIVRLRVCYLYQTMNPTLGVNLSDRQNGKRRLYGAFLSRNEPFSRGSNNS